jgi:hypothetical protein
LKKSIALQIFTSFSLLAAFVLLFTLATPLAQAQETSLHPPKIIVTAREVVKPGKIAAHEKSEAGWPAMFSKANWPVHYWAMSSMTGQNRVLFMAGYPSMADWEKDNLAQQNNAAMSATEDMLSTKDGEFLSSSETAVLTFMPDLSYQPDIPIKGLRYFQITVLRIKPGHSGHFEDIRKMVRAAHEKAGLDEHYWIYQFTMGQPAGSFVIFESRNSLAEIDHGGEMHGKAYQDALGGDAEKKFMEFRTQAVEGSETQLFVLSPKMSYPSQFVIDADPDFWKPAPAKMPAAKSAPAKKAAAPAASPSM